MRRRVVDNDVSDPTTGAPAPKNGYQLSVEPAPREAQQALRQEDDHDDEDEAERDQIGELVAEQTPEAFAEQQERGGADDRPDQGADAAHDVEDHRVAGHDEEHE